ncbi:hypothetical protein Q31b_49420 [Novipirellula aureliae]|uniref:Uncharacterized protein n=1 Tax=Novipirellula aureliae TaxID=2527966 RepID=A0A5C6DII0_9BACT|nr:hypothetical protein Q31b_49420 [Novipirellula aureliae]
MAGRLAKRGIGTFAYDLFDRAFLLSNVMPRHHTRSLCQKTESGKPKQTVLAGISTSIKIDSTKQGKAKHEIANVTSTTIARSKDDSDD